MPTTYEAQHPTSVHYPEAKRYPPLDEVTRPFLTTEEAAHYLNRQPQTLRIWASEGQVLTPLRIHGRLAWPVAALRHLLQQSGK
jgi:hypothetical protein